MAMTDKLIDIKYCLRPMLCGFYYQVLFSIRSALPDRSNSFLAYIAAKRLSMDHAKRNADLKNKMCCPLRAPVREGGFG